MFATLIAVAGGGAAGALGRYGLSVWVQRGLGMGFPWGTLAVNVVGDGLRDTLDPRIARKM